MRIAFTTLGCKINQYETDVMRQELQLQGNTIVPFDEEADVYVINTCSVTAKSDNQCRQVIRSAVRRGGEAKVIVTGCYAETRPDDLRAIPGVSLVVGNRDKSLLPGQIMKTFSVLEDRASSATKAPVTSVRGRTRSFLKIQDGCDNRCSYCIVPLARGSSRSAGLAEVTQEFEALVQAGCPEVVLTGIHIGTYGSDLTPRTDLSSLLGALLLKRGNVRMRLSSIEPNEVTPQMIGFLGHGLCRHLHIPLQSGDDSILQAMKRHYTAGFYLELLENIAQRVPGIALGADIMVGFPGEGEKEFQNTFDIIARSPLTHLHVFSYSPRPGTPAAEMEHQVPEPLKKSRSEALRSLAKKKNFEFRARNVGSPSKVVLEGKREASTGLLTGLTDNYLRVTVSGAKDEHIGKEIAVRIERIENEENFSVLI